MVKKAGAIGSGEDCSKPRSSCPPERAMIAPLTTGTQEQTGFLGPVFKSGFYKEAYLLVNVGSH